MNGKREGIAEAATAGSGPVAPAPAVACDPSGVPAELRSYEQWVCWRYEERDGRPTKVPIDARTGRMAKVSDPTTWSSFDDAVAALEASSKYAGVGFVFTDDDPFCGIDLDDCLEASGDVVATARTIMLDFGTYAEFSPGGCGVKLIGRGKKPPGAGCRTKKVDGFKELEVYDTRRFFCITGHLLPGALEAIRDCQGALTALCNRHWPPKPEASVSRNGTATPAQGGFHGDDKVLVMKAHLAKNGREFAALWNGDTSRYGDDESRADLALCNLLAFWTGRDADRMDRLFRQSGLMRPKWGERRGATTYGDMTIDRAIADCTEVYTPSRAVEQKGTGPTSLRASPYVLVAGSHKDNRGTYIEQSNADFAAAVLEQLPADAIYRRDHIGGELLGESGKRAWVEIPPDRMRLIVDSNMKLGKWVKSRQNGEQVMVYQPCSKDAASVVIAHTRQAPGIRELNLMVSYPIYGPGFVRVEPGWHDGLFYDEPLALKGLKPETDREVIHTVLDDLVTDFPFKGEADRHNFFGLMLTPIVAPALDGNRPMHLINSPLERTGKTKLVDEVLAGVLSGRQCPAMQITEREEEREKRVLAMLLQGETLMHLDNLPHFIDSGTLASLLTSHIFGSRVLGISRMVKLPNHLSIVGTGNNVQAAGEIAKRVVPILLAPSDAHPEDRDDFQHPDLRAYVRKQRRLVLECLLGMVEIWLEAGRPKHPRRFGGFESWSETVGGILQVAGFDAWRENEKDWRGLADPNGQEMETFIELWHEAYGLTEVTAAELMRVAETNDIFPYVFSRNTTQARGAAFGKLIGRRVDAPIGQWFIRQRKGRQAMYRLEAIQ